ncbi:flagellar filament capping protein FliD [Actinotalea fermentans]|uniref:Flagellar hook-associated protein 2 n=1 Tax=Actinotalea fermentans TaxID=43671 RepID=A0A511YZM1_9CELL|nr:flagellar filament capping protein FliD [Actinotalea fermentans]KGM14872.1 hypothetical protein N867_14605 [Actinotalea fermentans ATCC 43279 = JCM 9966 = DSM 3133]GEN80632.1 hypothetical protein AFE02nite_23660 [Actinotalea fermentans]
MATLGIDGLVSGLDTTTLINQLMQIEAGPQTQLKAKQSTTKSFVSALQSLNVRVASLAEMAAKVAKPESWQAWKATSSSTSVTASASGSAQAGSLSFTVDSVASTQVTLTDVVADDGALAGIPPQITVRTGAGALVTIQPTSGSLADVTKALNDAADVGVKATVVRVTNGETPLYRIQFTGTTTGETDGAFEVFRGDAAAVEVGTATRIDTATVRASSDAQLTLWKGTDAQQVYTQPSNTFTGLMTGVDVTVSKVTAADEAPTTITVAQDTDALKKLGSDLVNSLNVVLSEIASRSAVTTTTNSDGTTSVKGGLFTGETAVRAIQQQLSEAASYPVDGFSPSVAGITLKKDGTFTFDEAAFTKAFADDPAKVQTVLAGVAERVAEVATDVSDKYEGSLTLKIQGQEGLVKDMGTRIEDWDRRLAVRKEGLQRTYAALEVTMSNLTSQSNWLAGQLETLNANWSS